MAAKAMLARVYMTLAGYPYNDTNAKSLAKTQLENVLDDSHAAAYWAPSLEEWQNSGCRLMHITINILFSPFSIVRVVRETQPYSICFQLKSFRKIGLKTIIFAKFYLCGKDIDARI